MADTSNEQTAASAPEAQEPTTAVATTPLAEGTKGATPESDAPSPGAPSADGVEGEPTEQPAAPEPTPAPSGKRYTFHLGSVSHLLNALARDQGACGYTYEDNFMRREVYLTVPDGASLPDWFNAESFNPTSEPL